MHIPSVEPRLSEAAPWGRPEGSDETHLIAQEAPLAGLVLKGTLLTILTLGIYRFWYKTNLRRYYWANTRLLGDGFDYTGTGKELLIGFLIALAVIVPLNFSGTIIGLVAGEKIGLIAGSILAVLLVPMLVQVWLYRARRYRLARTRWRGIRFSQSGTVTGYFLASLKWLLLTVLTLGITLPYLRTAMQAYKIDNTWFGTQKATFGGEAKALMKPWMLVWFIFLGFSVGGGVLIATGIAIKAGQAFLGVFGLYYLLLIIGMFVAWMNYRAAEFRHFTARTAFGAIGFHSDVRARALIKANVLFYISYILVSAILLVAAITAGIFIAKLAGMSGSYAAIGGRVGAMVGAVGGALIVILYSPSAELFLRRRIWQIFTNSVTLTGISALDGILQASQDEAGAFGEAFDTGFDVAG